ncbi:MAG TPA: SDR family oxidoreductase [Burkholderiales bacterium]|nr:SDR family oxidoreductase [Burkholderiales bacterium]
MAGDRVLEGKVVIVTGAGRGIGRDIALLAAAHGAKVVVNDLGSEVTGAGRDEKVADQVVREIRAAGGEAIANTASVAEWDSASAIVEQAVATWGRLDGVVNNAGILRDRIFHKMEPDEWDAVIKVHLYGAFNVSRAAAGHFRKQQSGAYVHMTSGSGLFGNYGQANYGAAKLGIVGLSRQIALDMSRYRVRSNCIAPSAMSRMIEAIPTNTPEQAAHVEKRRRGMSPAKIAPMAVFLLSDLAAEVTGQIFSVRANEIFLISQPRPIRAAHHSEGWTPELIAERVMPAFKASLVPLERSRDVMPWDPM